MILIRTALVVAYIYLLWTGIKLTFLPLVALYGVWKLLGILAGLFIGGFLIGLAFAMTFAPAKPNNGEIA